MSDGSERPGQLADFERLRAGGAQVGHGELRHRAPLGDRAHRAIRAAPAAQVEADASRRRAAPARRAKGGRVMSDALFVGMTIGFFVLTWALIRLCERL